MDHSTKTWSFLSHDSGTGSRRDDPRITVLKHNPPCLVKHQLTDLSRDSGTETGRTDNTAAAGWKPAYSSSPLLAGRWTSLSQRRASWAATVSWRTSARDCPLNSQFILWMSVGLSLSVHLSAFLSVTLSFCLCVPLSVSVFTASVYLPASVFLSLSVGLSVSAFLPLSAYLPLSLSSCLCLSPCLCLSVCLSLCLPLSVCLSVCLPVSLPLCLCTSAFVT